MLMALYLNGCTGWYLNMVPVVFGKQLDLLLRFHLRELVEAIKVGHFLGVFERATEGRHFICHIRGLHEDGDTDRKVSKIMEMLYIIAISR